MGRMLIGRLGSLGGGVRGQEAVAGQLVVWGDLACAELDDVIYFSEDNHIVFLPGHGNLRRRSRSCSRADGLGGC